jgi:hypothetical protein
VNPYVILAAMLALAAAYGGGRWDGTRIERSAQAREDERQRATEEAAQRGAARAISAIKVTQTTIRQLAEKEIIREPQYVDPRCEHSDVVFGLLQRAYEAQRPEPAGAGGVRPGAAAAARQELRRDDAGPPGGSEPLF